MIRCTSMRKRNGQCCDCWLYLPFCDLYGCECVCIFLRLSLCVCIVRSISWSYFSHWYNLLLVCYFLSHLSFYWIESNWIELGILWSVNRFCTIVVTVIISTEWRLTLSICAIVAYLTIVFFSLEVTWDLYGKKYNNTVWFVLVDVCVPWSDSHSYMDSCIWRLNVYINFYCDDRLKSELPIIATKNNDGCNGNGNSNNQNGIQKWSTISLRQNTVTE